MRKISFQDLYKEHRDLPTPAQAFRATVAEITRKQVTTVKLWCLGLKAPDRLSREQIARHFDVDADSLFPEK